ncbi:hypothetical protein AVEN_203117-1 [Araneus ventricosus]|uniref:Uncharacterized protein n=1 Tax=Araneus ventricosus TaxID=182803 RepID=A0A4Y2DPS5_ARAVE|nr:hypothetical protein AVEN_203117-1 [Araneus ventricosus]
MRIRTNSAKYIATLDRVSFNDQLLSSAPKHTQHPEMMRQLSLELINNIPSQVLVLYTDGSKSDSGIGLSAAFMLRPRTVWFFAADFATQITVRFSDWNFLPSEKP